MMLDHAYLFLSLPFVGWSVFINSRLRNGKLERWFIIQCVCMMKYFLFLLYQPFECSFRLMQSIYNQINAAIWYCLLIDTHQSTARRWVEHRKWVIVHYESLTCALVLHRTWFCFSVFFSESKFNLPDETWTRKSGRGKVNDSFHWIYSSSFCNWHFSHDLIPAIFPAIFHIRGINHMSFVFEVFMFTSNEYFPWKFWFFMGKYKTYINFFHLSVPYFSHSFFRQILTLWHCIFTFNYFSIYLGNSVEKCS